MYFFYYIFPPGIIYLSGFFLFDAFLLFIVSQRINSVDLKLLFRILEGLVIKHLLVTAQAVKPNE
jgi:hypothetical protein